MYILDTRGIPTCENLDSRRIRHLQTNPLAHTSFWIQSFSELKNPARRTFAHAFSACTGPEHERACIANRLKPFNVDTTRTMLTKWPRNATGRREAVRRSNGERVCFAKRTVHVERWELGSAHRS